jgi:hypothetical protein
MALLYQGQIIRDGLEAHQVSGYTFFRGNIKDKDTWVNISEYADPRIAAGSRYVSQWTSGWYEFKSSDIANYREAERVGMIERVTNRIVRKEVFPFERFRYYKGAPASMGCEPRD